MNIYSRALRHINMEDVKQKHQKKCDEKKIQEQKVEEQKKYIKSVMQHKKYDWREELLKSDPINEVEEFIISNIEDKKLFALKDNVAIDPKIYERWKTNYNLNTEIIGEAMGTKDFEYIYGLSVYTFDSIMGKVMNPVQNSQAQEIVQASSEYSGYKFGPEFPGSYVNSIGDNSVVSQSKVDAVAFFDTTYGNASGGGSSFSLDTGVEGLPPGLERPPGSVVSRVNLQSALGITLPDGVYGNLGGTPIEGSAVKRVFTNAEPGRRINFNWNFASSEDALGPETVDDYAFVAIKGSVTKIVSVLTRGLNNNGEFIYTLKPEDIGPNNQVEVSIGVIDVFDPYVQTRFNVYNFGSFYGAGSLGKTTDAADLGMSVAAADPNFDTSKMEKDYGTIAGGVNYNLFNYILKTFGGAAAGWYEMNPTKPHTSNPHLPSGAYVPPA